MSLIVGDSVALKSTVTPSNSTQGLKWTSSDSLVATVSDGNCAVSVKDTIYLEDVKAIESAKKHLKYSSYSEKKLVEALVDEGFTEIRAKYAANSCGADWDAEALECAQSYMKYSYYTKSKLMEGLLDEGFTESQVQKAINSLFP